MHKWYQQVNNVSAGALSGLLIVIMATAFSALIFNGRLAIYFPIGVSCAVIGSCLVNLITASFSTFSFSIARVEPAAGAILAIVCAHIASRLPSVNLLPTLIATFSSASFLIGIAMFMLGRFRLGQIVRYLPYPVLGGVIAGTAWIMAKASFMLMVNNTLTFKHLADKSTLLQCITGFAFTFLLVFANRKFSKQYWVLPLLVVLSSMIINLALQYNNISHLTATSTGWLFSSFAPAFYLKTANFTMFNHIEWSAIFAQSYYLISLAGIVIILLLLNVSSLEIMFSGKSNVEHELKIAGFANIIGGMLNGIPANLSLSGTILNKNTGANSKIAGIIASLTCLVILLVWPSLISFMPKPVISGLLCFIAINLLIEWLYEGRKKLPKTDYLIVISIVVSMALLGFLPGVIIGILITCSVFIIRYTRINAIRFTTTGEHFHSHVIRPPHQQHWLHQYGNTIQLFKLHGYLFFGSAKLFFDRITELFDKEYNKHLRFLIFDFQSVIGIDSSAAFSFIRLLKSVANKPVRFIYTGCASSLLQQFEQQGIANYSSQVMIFSDLDQGIEYCEEQLLSEMPVNGMLPTTSFTHMMNQLIPDTTGQTIFTSYLIKQEISANHYLFKQGDHVDCLYFIESGEVTVLLEDTDSVIRISKSGPGTIVGEIGFYLQSARTATVKTVNCCIVYQLTFQALHRLEIEHPTIAMQFHKSIIQVLAMRVVQTNYELKLASR